MWSVILLYSLLISSIVGQNTNDIPTVNIAQGTVAGSIAEDGEFFEFYGIPYADSTSGTHRFKAPRPAPSFQETFVANRRDVKCVRALGVGYEGTEDCLVANVFTPSLENNSLLPVMVWIKGKEFDRVYEHELSFKNIIEKDVVVVSLNFRESILGFLCIGTETAPGNAGLKDIIAGLRWIRENIANFGGDPDNISIFGHGSGAAAVDLITMSPMANGLVHKAIAQSGTALAPWAVTRDNLEYAILVAEALGHTITNTEQLSEIFTRTSVAALMAVINELDLTDNSLAFAPCLERGDIEDVEPFLTKSPYQTIVDREFLQIPFMTGFVDSEGTIRAEEAIEDDWIEKMDASFTDFLQPDLQFENDSEREQVAAQIRTRYFNNQGITMSNIKEYISYQGDTLILVSALREVRLRATASTADTYLYQFSYKGSLGEPFEGPLEIDTAAHSEELAYLFHDTIDDEIPIVDLTVGDILIERWTNFAKTGSPTSETSQIDWEPFTASNPALIRILDDDEVNEGTLEINVLNPHAETELFWDQIYDEHFLDAVGKWKLPNRDDEDDDEVVTDEPGPDTDDNDGDNDGNGDDDGDDDGDDNGDEDGDENDPDSSAASAVGYTFFIIALFSMLGHFHSSQILS